MKVAVLGIKALPASAGADRVVEQLLEQGSPDLEFTIYLLRAPAEARLSCSDRRRYVYVPALPGKHLGPASYFLLCCLHYLLRLDRPDVIHVHNSDFGLLCPLLRLKRGVRIVGTFHGDPYKREKWGRLAKLVLRVSEWTFTRTCDALTSVSASKRVEGRTVAYIPNGVKTELRPDAPEPAIVDGEFVMFAASRIDRTKGLHLLLEAFRGLETTLRLLVVGDFSHDARYTRELESAAAADDRVMLHRRLLPKDQLVETVRLSTLFVFPSEIEGMSMMLLEALSAGAQVVCSDIEENVAVVGAGYRYLFRTGDVVSLRSSLDLALTEAPIWDASLLADDIAARFHWSTIARQYEYVYLDGRERPAAVRPVMSLVRSLHGNDLDT